MCEWEAGGKDQVAEDQGRNFFLRKLVGNVGALLHVWAGSVFHPFPQAKVIQTKSAQHFSFSLTIATLLASASWTLYGFRLKDPYITVSRTGMG